VNWTDIDRKPRVPGTLLEDESPPNMKGTVARAVRDDEGRIDNTDGRLEGFSLSGQAAYVMAMPRPGDEGVVSPVIRYDVPQLRDASLAGAIDVSQLTGDAYDRVGAMSRQLDELQRSPHSLSHPNGTLTSATSPVPPGFVVVEDKPVRHVTFDFEGAGEFPVRYHEVHQVGAYLWLILDKRRTDIAGYFPPKKARNFGVDIEGDPMVYLADWVGIELDRDYERIGVYLITARKDR
jgi:hypothetical protein